MIDWIVSHLSGGHTQPARDTLPVNNGVDFGREPASEVTETMIRPPYAVAACWCARMEGLSIIWCHRHARR
jgi:hypothetical protein